MNEKEALSYLAQNLTDVLETEGVTQNELALMIKKRGENLSTINARISRTVHARNMPSPAFLFRLCQALNCDMDSLFKKPKNIKVT